MSRIVFGWLLGTDAGEPKLLIFVLVATVITGIMLAAKNRRITAHEGHGTRPKGINFVSLAMALLLTSVNVGFAFSAISSYWSWAIAVTQAMYWLTMAFVAVSLWVVTTHGAVKGRFMTAMIVLHSYIIVVTLAALSRNNVTQNALWHKPPGGWEATHAIALFLANTMVLGAIILGVATVVIAMVNKARARRRATSPSP